MQRYLLASVCPSASQIALWSQYLHLTVYLSVCLIKMTSLRPTFRAVLVQQASPVPAIPLGNPLRVRLQDASQTAPEICTLRRKVTKICSTANPRIIKNLLPKSAPCDTESLLSEWLCFVKMQRLCAHTYTCGKDFKAY